MQETLDNSAIWRHCIERLEHELPAQQFNTWIRPLQAVETPQEIRVFAPNRFVLDWVKQHFLPRIEATLTDLNVQPRPYILLEIGSKPVAARPGALDGAAPTSSNSRRSSASRKPPAQPHNINPAFTFESFVEGKSNQLAKAASLQAAAQAGHVYNPLFIYGGVGLGKTHLMHAVGNQILRQQPGARLLYLHSERFVTDMVKALQHNTIGAFKEHYRNVDALLIDDIQFFAGKERSQEEFFHTFNSLLEDKRQVIITCDRYPKEIEGLDERLKSRFGWGLPVAIEPPDLETRVAILKNKAREAGQLLGDDVAFFIGKRVRSNVRELEGALRRVMAAASLMGHTITLAFAKECLRDLLVMQDKLVSIDNIQKTVAEYYKLSLSDLLSNSRSRAVARPRQISMALIKELTNHSFPEIGQAFGGRDHTTVLYACRKVKELRGSDSKVAADYHNLLQIFSQ